MLRFGLFGAGRIGSMHARNLAANPRVELAYVYDIDEPAARKAAEGAGARVAPDMTTILTDASRGRGADRLANEYPCRSDQLSQPKPARRYCARSRSHFDIALVNQCRDQIADCKVADPDRLQPALRSRSPGTCGKRFRPARSAALRNSSSRAVTLHHHLSTTSKSQAVCSAT